MAKHPQQHPDVIGDIIANATKPDVIGDIIANATRPDELGALIDATLQQSDAQKAKYVVQHSPETERSAPATPTVPKSGGKPPGNVR